MSPKKTKLTITASPSKVLSPAQVEFNRSMKALEKARAAHDAERARLDAELKTCQKELLPLLERFNRTERDLIFTAHEASKQVKLTQRRHKWFTDLLSGKASDLLIDPVGLSEEDIQRLQALVTELGPSLAEEQRKELESEKFDFTRDFMEGMARQAGIDLDLSGLDINGDPRDFDRQMQERLNAAREQFQKNAGDAATPPPAKKRKSKPSKAALQREQRQREMEEAKNRDFKTLYKQLAKVLHPDLETDPKLKEHKETWMKRLTTARDNGDLRDMLAIEMEWLGEEAGNLSHTSDEKLRIYAMVLKEQTHEIKAQTQMLQHEPQYHLLERFTDDFGWRPPPNTIKREISADIRRLEKPLADLRSGGTTARKIIHTWADEHAQMWENDGYQAPF